MFLLIRGTQAVQLMFGVLLLAVIGLLANLLDLRLLSWIFRNAAPAILIGIIVLFQPEIRRALDQFGRIGFIGRPLAHYNLQIFNRMIDEVIRATTDRKSTRLNSSHSQISYAVFCLKKKK